MKLSEYQKGEKKKPQYIRQWWDPEHERIVTEITDHYTMGIYEPWTLPTGLYTTNPTNLIPLIEDPFGHVEPAIEIPDYDRYALYAVATGQMTGREDPINRDHDWRNFFDREYLLTFEEDEDE